MARHKRIFRDTSEKIELLSKWKNLQDQGLSAYAAAKRLGVPASSLFGWDRKGIHKIKGNNGNSRIVPRSTQKIPASILLMLEDDGVPPTKKIALMETYFGT